MRTHSRSRIRCRMAAALGVIVGYIMYPAVAMVIALSLVMLMLPRWRSTKLSTKDVALLFL